MGSAASLATTLASAFEAGACGVAGAPPTWRRPGEDPAARRGDEL